MLFSATAITAIVAVANAQKQYVATFNSANTLISGTVTVNDGQVIVDIDLSEGDSIGLPGGFDTCTSGGLSYHIHETYSDSTNDDQVGSACMYTGGHYDPWAACGSASGNEYCGSDSDSLTCVNQSSYSPDLAADPFSVEVGDWSGKYGKLVLDSNNKLSRTDSSFYEVKSSEMAGLSVTFHCANSERAFCAPFLEGTEDVTTVEIPPQALDVVADFSTALEVDSSKITLSGDGSIDISLDVTKVFTPSPECSTLSYGIFEAGSMELTDSMTSCSGYVGAQYDPTHACLSDSSSPYCYSGVLCNGFGDSNYTYECDFENDRYSCAPGDLAGKLDETLTTTLSVSYSGSDSLIPPPASLVGKVMALQCAESGEAIACAPIVEDTDSSMQYVATFSSDNNGIEGTVTVNDGQVIVDLDLSAQPELPGGFDSCTSGGLSYHIHNKWTNPDSSDQIDSMCGAAYTGGHYDPYNACGSASGSEYCTYFTCLNGAYSPSFLDEPFSVEVGDWSSKYYKLELDENNKISRTDASYYEVMSAEVAGLSVVFHCNDGSRAFCAPFEKSTTAVTAAEYDQDFTNSAGYDTVFANFQAALTTESQITLQSNGDVKIYLDATEIYPASNLANTAGCETLAYGVFNYPAEDIRISESRTDCEYVVGYAYDPTTSCYGVSMECSRDVFCGGSSYTYDCDFENDRYSCAPGDLSGKFGMLSNPGTDFLDIPSGTYGDDSLLPLMRDLEGKLMAIYCADEGKQFPYSPTFLACAPIEVDESGVKGFSFIMASIVSLSAVLFS